MSTSTCKDISLDFARNYSCLYTITITKSQLKYLMPLESISTSITTQFEILLPLGTILKVNKVSHIYGLRCFELSLIDYDTDLILSLQKLFLKYPRLVPKTIKHGGSPILTTETNDALNKMQGKFMSFVNVNDFKAFINNINANQKAPQGGNVNGKYTKSTHRVLYKTKSRCVYIGIRGGWHVKVDNEYKRVKNMHKLS